jgi:tetratricopeptide (TPR) repeat protein
MPTLFDSLLKISSNLAETGLLVMDSALKTAQAGIGSLVGQQPHEPLKPPLQGPPDLDSAISDLANRTARIARFTPFEASYAPKFLTDFLEAAKRSFANIDWKDPKNLVLPLQVPFSIGTLMTQSALRGLASLEIVGPKAYPTFLANVFEMFTEIQIYVGVEYQELIDIQEKRLHVAPQDSAARVELGRVLIKCGRYIDAARELKLAAEDPAVRELALHECAVANYRAGYFRQAVADGSAAMAVNPGNERARAFLWLSAQRIGGYPPEVPAAHRMEMKVGYEKPVVEFEDIAIKVGLDKTSAGRGLAVFDYNNDGNLDVVIAAAQAGCSLYRNNGDGTFTDVSVGSGLDDCVNGFAITAGDYNNDGLPDLFITRLGFFVGEGMLMRNNGDGTFTDVTEKAGLKFWGPAFTACWVDYDGDGFLDLFIVNNLGGLFDRKAKNRLYHNNGDGTFTEVSDQAGLKTIWPTIGACWGDYDNDGRPDLYVSNAMGRAQLYHNNGDGTFTDVSAEAGLDEFCIGSTAFWVDYDNDGWLDLVQFAWSDHEDVVYTMRNGDGPPHGNHLRLYHNNRNGTFTMRSDELGLTGCWGTMSGNAGDFNNDGYIDFVLGNGSPRMDRLEPLVLLENDGKKFRNTTFAAGLPFTGKGHGGNVADLFGDGRLSVLVATGGAYPGELLTTSCFYPKRLAGNFLNIRLTGVKSNRDAIGARVSIEAGGRKQYREIGGGTNFGCLPCEQHFGLAQIEEIDALEIRWPSGLKQRFEKPPINTTIRIVEGADRWEFVYRKDWEQLSPGDKVVWANV